MNTLTKSFTSLWISVFFLSSFLFGSTFLNGNLFIKQFGVELIISIFSIFVCCTVLIKKNFIEIRLNTFDLLVILLLLTYTCSIIVFSSNPIEHCLSYYYGLLYFVSTFLVRQSNKVEFYFFKSNFILIAVVTVFVHFIIVVLQQIGAFPPMHGYFKNGSTFGNPDMLGSYIAVLSPFCFILNSKWKRTGIIISLTCILLLIFIQARSALFAIVLCGFLWLILNKRISKIMVFILSSASIALLVLLIFWHPESVYGRFFIWFVSIKMIIQKPFGWGIFAFEKHYPEFQASYLSVNQSILKIINPDVVHSPFNEFLNIGVTLGIIGLLIYVLIVIFIFYNAVKLKSQLIYPLFIFFIISMFYFPLQISSLIVLVVPLTSLISSRITTTNPKILMISVKFIFVPLILISLFLTINSISRYRSYKNWQQAVLYLKNEEDLNKSERLFSSLYPSMKENGRFLITYSNLKYKEGFPEKTLNLLEEAELYFCDITLSLKFAKLYEELGLYEKAEKKFDLAINIAPNNFTAPYEKILFLEKIGEHERAYHESLQLINKPIRSSIYADAVIMKSRLKKLIKNYELQNRE